MKVIVYDSGIGGLSVLSALLKKTCQTKFMYLFDSGGMPYGSKSPESLTERAVNALEYADNAFHADMAVIACNTLTANCIDVLRKLFSFRIIGIEPPIKQLAHITKPLLLATPQTVNAPRIKERFEKYGYVGLSLPDLAQMIENELKHGQPKDDIHNSLCIAGASQSKNHCCNRKIGYSLIDKNGRHRISSYVRQAFCKSDVFKEYGSTEEVKGLAIGCTHYSLAADAISSVFPKAVTADGAVAVASYAAQEIAKSNVSINTDLHAKPRKNSLSFGNTVQFCDFAQNKKLIHTYADILDKLRQQQILI
ncbi:MAG: hypothetical protein PHX51_05300 [Clostridia bacterium]|nr:hypothetical protein [Clostridia bacterium]